MAKAISRVWTVGSKMRVGRYSLKVVNETGAADGSGYAGGVGQLVQPPGLTAKAPTVVNARLVCPTVIGGSLYGRTKPSRLLERLPGHLCPTQRTSLKNLAHGRPTASSTFSYLIRSVISCQVWSSTKMPSFRRRCSLRYSISPG